MLHTIQDKVGTGRKHLADFLPCLVGEETESQRGQEVYPGPCTRASVRAHLQRQLRVLLFAVLLSAQAPWSAQGQPVHHRRQNPGGDPMARRADSGDMGLGCKCRSIWTLGLLVWLAVSVPVRQAVVSCGC